MSFLDQFLADGPTMVCGDFNGRHKTLLEGGRQNKSGVIVADLLYSGRFCSLGGKEATHKKGGRLDLWVVGATDITGLFGKVKVGD